MILRSTILFTLALVAWIELPHHCLALVVQKFDENDSGTPYDAVSCLFPPMGPTHELVDGGPTGVGRFLQLAFPDPIPNHNAIAFPHTPQGVFDQVVVDFDFRIKPGTGQADGFGVALLKTEHFGLEGAVCPQLPPLGGPLAVAEEPDFKGSLGFGFDIHQAAVQEGPGADLNNNHISIHFDSVEQAEFDVTPALTLAGSEWIHGRILVSPGEVSGIVVTIVLQQRGGLPFTAVEDFALPFVDPYASRVWFGARSGGESASQEIDNIEVQFSNLNPSVVSLGAVSFDTREDDSHAVITVLREGDTTSSVTVDYNTDDGSAMGGSDYQPAMGSLDFAPGETEKSFDVFLLDDVLNEGDEVFLVSLGNPSAGATVGGPSMAGVRIIDNETSRLVGHWSHILGLPTVPVHLHKTPTGKVLFWQIGGGIVQVYLWDPATGMVSQTPMPPYDIFCSGHAWLANGQLLVTGGHNGTDGEGVRHATRYDPYANTWNGVPDMGNADQIERRRWYPTNTILGNGDVLVLSGSYDAIFSKNTLPQIYRVESNDWHNLANAQQLVPLGGDIYPRMLLAPDGRVFKVGDPQSWFLDVAGLGQWHQGPDSVFQQETRTYGPAVFYDGKVLLLGGGGGDEGGTPTATMELIDLNQMDPQWAEIGEMTSGRRHHNATLLPDGTVLVTGGTSCGGFNCSTGAVLEAELWDPESQSWTILAPMIIKRLYHSTALLLQDGRVMVAGGGRPAATGEVDHYNAEIFSPPYLFKGPRPAIVSAPNVVGSTVESFVVETPDAQDITEISLIRLGSVTHAFDHNQRFLTLPFSEVDGDLIVTVPPNPNLAPPGHYLLFILNHSGVPSMGHIINLQQDSEPSTCESPSELNLTGFSINSKLTCKAGTVLTASEFEIVAPDGAVSFHAGQGVGLGEGFRVELGTTFNARVVPAPQLVQRFDVDDDGASYDVVSCLFPPLEPTHELVEGGPTGVGKFLRLAFADPIPNDNSISFFHAPTGTFDHVTVDFDFRMTPGSGQADGIGFALLNTEHFDTQGPVCPQGPLGASEEPDFRGSLGIGFDIHKAATETEPGVDPNNNHVSVHFDEIELAEFDVTPEITLAGSEWIHAKILVGPSPTGMVVTIILQQGEELPFTVVENFLLPSVSPYPSRALFAARSGGESAHHDIDNIEVRFVK